MKGEKEKEARKAERERERKQNNVNAERQTLGQLSWRVERWRGVWG